VRNGLSRGFTRIHKQFADWSLSLFCFDAGLSFIVTYPLGCLLQMSWTNQFVMFAGALFTVTSGIFVYLAASRGRVRRSADKLRALASAINISGLTVQPMRRIGPPRDPISEAGIHIKAAFNDDIYARYWNSVETGPRDLNAKIFLESLADSLSLADFRG
jgi:hypothetical protein